MSGACENGNQNEGATIDPSNEKFHNVSMSKLGLLARVRGNQYNP